MKSDIVSCYKDGLSIGRELNNAEWHGVYVVVTASQLILGIYDRIQINEPHSISDLDTVFHNTYFGGIEAEQRILDLEAPFLTGCVQDIFLDGKKITEEDFRMTDDGDVKQVNTSVGCPRKHVCQPNPCQNEEICTDLWNDFQCSSTIEEA